jgi:hypothetical protein
VSRAIIQRATPAATSTPASEPTFGKDEESCNQADELTHDDKIELLVRAGDRVVGAKDEFNAACDAIAAKLAKVAKLEAEIAGLCIDVGMGLLLPGLGAIEASFVRGVVTEMGLAQKFLVAAEKIDKDLAKASVTGLTKGVVTTIKNSSSEFADKDVTSFLKQLRTEAGLANQQARDNLSLNNVDGLFGAIAAYDIKVTNQTTYAAKLSSLLDAFVGQVEGQGRKVAVSGFSSWTTDTFAALLMNPSSGQAELAVVRRDSSSVAGISNKHSLTFQEWVLPELTKEATDKTIELTGKPPEMFPSAIVDGIPGA